MEIYYINFVERLIVMSMKDTPIWNLTFLLKINIKGGIKMENKLFQYEMIKNLEAIKNHLLDIDKKLDKLENKEVVTTE